MTAQGYGGSSCDRYLDASGVTATQACSVACSGGAVTRCQGYDNCWDSPCLNGGVCTDGIGTFTCDCTNTGFCGRTCADPAFAVQAQHGGQCPCEDDVTWAGCRNPPCQQGGYSSSQPVGCDAMTARGGYPCDAYRDAHGVTATQACTVACAGGDVTACPAYDNCWNSPCLNGGVCTDGTPSFTCACPSHYGGPACETYCGPSQDCVRASVRLCCYASALSLRDAGVCCACSVRGQRHLGIAAI